MADEKWLLIDCLSSAHRLFHGMAPLNGPDKSRTEVIYGFLRDIKKWERQFAPCRFFFFFDSGMYKRKDLYPEYKGNREASRAERKGTPKDDAFLQSQVFKLCFYVLPALGYNNVYHVEGYEADDLIAIFCRNNVPQYPSRTAVIVSSDHDFHQCLFGHVMTDLGGTRVLKQSYVEQYDPRSDSITTAVDVALTRQELILAKAIEGCRSDNIPGVEGYGPVKSKKFALGCKDFKKLGELEPHRALIERNIKLVALPIDWNVIMEVENDSLRDSKLAKVMSTYGIRSLR